MTHHMTNPEYPHLLDFLSCTSIWIFMTSSCLNINCINAPVGWEHCVLETGFFGKIELGPSVPGFDNTGPLEREEVCLRLLLCPYWA
jgi:hypothetical protein